jgi:hypothetical protein
VAGRGSAGPGAASGPLAAPAPPPADRAGAACDRWRTPPSLLPRRRGGGRGGGGRDAEAGRRAQRADRRPPAAGNRSTPAGRANCPLRCRSNAPWAPAWRRTAAPRPSSLGCACASSSCTGVAKRCRGQLGGGRGGAALRLSSRAARESPCVCVAGRWAGRCEKKKRLAGGDQTPGGGGGATPHTQCLAQICPPLYSSASACAANSPWRCSSAQVSARA